MNLVPGRISIVVSDDRVGIIVDETVGFLSAKVACEVAQSLIIVAKEADPSIDPEAIMKAYSETHKPFTNVTYIN